MNNFVDYEFISSRAQATRDVQAQIAADWVWEDKTLAAWDAELKTIAELRQAEIVAETSEMAVRAQRDQAHKELDRKTLLGVAILKTKARNDPAKLAAIQALPPLPQGRPQSRLRAQRLAEAWQQHYPEFVADTELSLTTLNASLEVAERLDTQTSAAKVAWRNAANTLTESLASVNDDAKTWYYLATRRFPESTPQGQLIRSRIQTQYVKPKTPVVPPDLPPQPV
jgi:hypothetical protein